MPDSPTDSRDASLPSRRAPAAASDPLWYRDAIIYELHVRAFQDTTGDGIGDFEGLRQRLPYIRDLGVTALWLLPFYPSPLRDDGYDIADYTSVHPDYGTMRDFERFLDEAHALDLRVITELVINHTSDRHPWFDRARKAPPGSVERDFYVWSDTPEKYAGVPIIFSDTERSNWTWDATAKAHYWHRFFSHQPDLNFANPAVLDAVREVMRFWLDKGVDGLRLDAIPYLCEREGTACAHLPETHEILKALRKDLDARYEGRVFLAEANAWPADVRPYFGDGDECHMAFHFPLMPRLFMALRKEDRHPITEILAQTPEIPEACQWALFLRNHDELTLEMVTDEERDYMFAEYANDARMRLNRGIRRRLAPLVEFSRRRMELLHSLLFSLPGTPVLYYGDEIGMGDNIYLGDRNGVRTPMQWTGDRNAGFSSAESARLYSPILVDPQGGFHVANVEAQERSRTSFLHWMKRLVAVRRQRPAFGRGSIEMLEPKNRRVLAFVREYRGERLLVVANLSRFVQPVEIDLSRWRGLVPIELFGKAAFPRIGDAPYFLSLGPHEFNWFSLRGRTLARAEAGGSPDSAEGEAPLLAFRGAPADFAMSGGLEELAALAWPRHFTRRCASAARGRVVRDVRVLDRAVIDGAAAALFVLALARVGFDDGRFETWFVPLALVPAAAAAGGEAARRATVARFASGDGAEDSLVLDAFRSPEFGESLVSLFGRGAPLAGEKGTFAGTGAAARSASGMPESDADGNALFALGPAALVKAFRRIESGVHPESEVARALAAGGFRGALRVEGELAYRDRAGRAFTLALVRESVPHQGDGASIALDHLGRFFERAHALSDRGLAPNESTLGEAAVRDLLGSFAEAMRVLGRRTGEMHRALALASPAREFAPERLRPADVGGLAETVSERAAAVLAALDGARAGLDPAEKEFADRLVARRDALLARAGRLWQRSLAGERTRIHGDYRLASVFRVENDFVLRDFAGDTSLPLAERRSKDSPLRDVASMLRSLGAAAREGLERAVADRPEDRERLLPWMRLWERLVREAFLSGYDGATRGAASVPENENDRADLLDAYELNEWLRDALVEIDRRPDRLARTLGGLGA